MNKHPLTKNEVINLLKKISIESIESERIELLLAEDNGRWVGVGKSNIREFTTTILTPKTYQNGLQSFSLELAMRDNTSIELEKLNGISDILFYLSTENE